MKNFRLLFAAILMTSSLLANAQAPAASAPAAAPVAPAPAVVAPKPHNAEKFAAHKERALDRIGKQQQTLQTLQTCIQAANDRAALKACRKAAHPGHHGRRHHKDNDSK